jgi:VanZ family protein
MESTDFASSGNTGDWLFEALRVFLPHLRPWYVWQLNEILRKVGHFTGYAILSVLVLLALRNTYRDRLRPVMQRPWGIYLRDYWRWEWVILGMMASVVTASFDEMHQAFIASRTGRWQDVVIDSSGAVVAQLLLYVYSVWKVSRQGDSARQRELQPYASR